MLSLHRTPKGSPTGIRPAIAYKNFAAYKGISHIGLGVTGITNVKVLQAYGYTPQVWPVVNNIEIANHLYEGRKAGKPTTHLVVSAPWLSTYDVSTLARVFTETKFCIVSHSNFGFLQADPQGVRLLREAADLAVATPNVHVGGNSEKFVAAFRAAFGKPAVYLPNLYGFDESLTDARHYSGGVLRVGSFGALRPLKNTVTAAAAALALARGLHADLEFWISGGRMEGGGDVVLRAIQQLYANLPGAQIVQAQWRPWGSFRTVIRHMHLLMQVSYTESFNMVTADGVAEGVPSVVSDAITWAPKRWKAMADDVSDVARVGAALIKNSQRSVREGRKALAAHTRDGVKAWQSFLH